MNWLMTWCREKCKAVTEICDDSFHWRVYMSPCVNALSHPVVSRRYHTCIVTRRWYMEWNERVKITADFDIFFTLKNPFYWADVFLHGSGLSTHWGRVTHVYASVNELVMIGSDNVLSPGRRQAFIWNNVGILLTESLGTNFSENFNEIYSFSFGKMHLKISPENNWPFCLGLDVFIRQASYKDSKINTIWVFHFMSVQAVLHRMW